MNLKIKIQKNLLGTNIYFNNDKRSYLSDIFLYDIVVYNLIKSIPILLANIVYINNNIMVNIVDSEFISFSKYKNGKISIMNTIINHPNKVS